MASVTVWAIPLADHGFSCGCLPRCVRWYLERYDGADNKLMSGGFKTKDAAEAWGRERGWEVHS